MARGTRGRQKAVGKFRDLGAKPAALLVTAQVMDTAADAPPPAKKLKSAPVDLSLPLTPTFVPPSLPTPSPSPSSLTSPVTTLSVLPPSSPLLPPSPTSPLSPSLIDHLETLLLMRNIQTQIPPGRQAQLFTRSQLCLAESYMDQLETMGPSTGRVDRLLDYLISAVGTFRIPPGRLLCRLWALACNDKVLEVVGQERVLQLSCLFHSLLSLHQPWSSSLAHLQLSQLVTTLGADTGTPFAAWLHIRRLLSPPGYKYYHHHLAFLVDLLLSDFWSHVHRYRTGTPLFVSVFWRCPSDTDSMSLPVRQLLDSISLSLHNYTATRPQLQVLQSQLALLFLVMTTCSEAVDQFLQLSLKLTSQQFLLVAGSLHPISLVEKLYQHRYLHSRGTTRNTEAVDWLYTNGKVLPDIGVLKLCSSVSPSTQLSLAIVSVLKELQCSTVPANGDPSSSEPPAPNVRTSTTAATASTTAPVHQSPANTATASTTAPVHQSPANTATASTTAPVHTSLVQSPATTNAHVPNKFYSPAKKKQPLVTVTYPLRPPAATTLPPLHSTKRTCQQFVRRSSTQPRAAKRLVNWGTASAEKKRRLLPPVGTGRACENCNIGTFSCHRCNT